MYSVRQTTYYTKTLHFLFEISWIKKKQKLKKTIRILHAKTEVTSSVLWTISFFFFDNHIVKKVSLSLSWNTIMYKIWVSVRVCAIHMNMKWMIAFLMCHLFSMIYYTRKNIFFMCIDISVYLLKYLTPNIIWSNFFF